MFATLQVVGSSLCLVRCAGTISARQTPLLIHATNIIKLLNEFLLMDGKTCGSTGKDNEFFGLTVESCRIPTTS